MGFDLVGWAELAPGTGTVGITAGLADQRYETLGDQIRIKRMAPVLNALWYAAATTPAEARLRATSRLQDLQFLKACDINDATFEAGLSYFGRTGILLRGGEMHTGLSVNATDEHNLILATLGPGAIYGLASPTHIIHGTSAQTWTAVTWTNLGTITWDQALPDGIYYIVGMKAGGYIASGFELGGVRCILDKSVWRPGVPIDQAEADKAGVMSSLGWAPTHHWGLHKDLLFHSKTMPTFEGLSTVALTSTVIELELVAADARDIGTLAPEGGTS